MEQLLFTHYHRDQLCGATQFPHTAAIGAPAAERDLLANPGPRMERRQPTLSRLPVVRPDHLTPTEPLRVARALGMAIDRVRARHHPGDGDARHTDGSLSFLVEADGKRTVFSGDCLAGPGKLWDIHSLQRGFAHGGQEIGGYHGFLGDRWRLAESLEKIKHLQPTLLVPSHGVLMDNPAEAIDALLAAIESCYEKYVVDQRPATLFSQVVY